MQKRVLFWILAFIITIAGAYYQRVTGPTYPVTGKVNFENQVISYKLETSHSTSSDYKIEIPVKNNNISGIFKWKRYKTDDEWTLAEMSFEEGKLAANLPKQPAAGKLQYQVILKSDNSEISIPANHPIIIRFKGDVPPFILIPHIIAMFGTMLLSTRTGLEIFTKEPKLKKYTFWTLGFLIAGGMILGPITQLYAFGELWTGIPFGIDLTDNKTLIALIGWIIATVALYKSKYPKRWIMAAAILLLIIYSIPHSVLGSELDYNKLDNSTNSKITLNK